MASSNRIIGIDESGKGDFFGPLVVAGCLADADQCRWLREIGVRDSKLITEKKLLSIDEQLRDRLAYALVVLVPEDYNKQYAEIRNLNVLLASCHARVIKTVLEQNAADLAISDKFGKEERLVTAMARIECHIPLKQIVRGESVPQVAAASIMARAEFIRRMDDLSATCGITIPRGASAEVDRVGRQIVATHGLDALTGLAKAHFKNYQRVTNPNLFTR